MSVTKLSQRTAVNLFIFLFILLINSQANAMFNGRSSAAINLNHNWGNSDGGNSGGGSSGGGSSGGGSSGGGSSGGGLPPMGPPRPVTRPGAEYRPGVRPGNLDDGSRAINHYISLVTQIENSVKQSMSLSSGYSTQSIAEMESLAEEATRNIAQAQNALDTTYKYLPTHTFKTYLQKVINDTNARVEEIRSQLQALKKLESWKQDETFMADIKQYTSRVMGKFREIKERQKAVHAEPCFPAETPISVIDDSSQGYHSQAISTIRVGDTVVSCNLSVDGGICEFGEVQAITERPANHLVRLTYGDHKLRATDNHPFYVVEMNGWVEASELKVGQHFLNILGDEVELESKSDEWGDFTVYNLDVKGNHNYYACDVLVHNCNTVAALGTAVGAGAEGASAIGSVLSGAMPLAVPIQSMQEIREGIENLQVHSQADASADSPMSPPVKGEVPIKYNHPAKLKDQMKQRGWTEKEVREALEQPGIPTQGKAGPATRYVHPKTGKSVVKDNKTEEIFHVGGEGYKYD